MITVACYSTGTPYENEAELLRASLERVKMAHHIVGFPSKGDWYANTAYKAEFIRNQRRELRGPMLYVDVDAFVHANCEAYFKDLGRRGIDFAAHWFGGPAKGHNVHDRCSCILRQRWDVWRDQLKRHCSREHRLLSGTLFFGDTDGARQFLDSWCALNTLLRSRGLLQGGGQKNLWYLTTCAEKMGSLNLVRFPGRYTYVFDKPFGYPVGEPCIIEHTIASRDNRASKRQTEPRRARKHQLMRILEGKSDGGIPGQRSVPASPARTTPDGRRGRRL